MDALPFQPRQLSERHRQDFARLCLTQIVAFPQLREGCIRRCRVLDKFNDVLQVLQRRQIPFQDMRATLGTPQVKLSAPADDFAAVF